MDIRHGRLPSGWIQRGVVGVVDIALGMAYTQAVALHVGARPEGERLYVACEAQCDDDGVKRVVMRVERIALVLKEYRGVKSRR